MPSKARSKPQPPIPVDLALQGGGAHGAFTWGVLDRLLEANRFDIEGISGTSAGAMNAAVLASGMAGGGPERARALLAEFWGRVADAARFSPFQRGPLDRLMGNWTLDNNPAFIAMDLSARLISPYLLGGLTGNPLKQILEDLIDFEQLAKGPIKLFITATNVHTGRGRVFRRQEISADVLLASACLPTLYQAVEINGVPYWDGGYAGNPTMTPLVRECDSNDTILVQINPVERVETPTSAREIASRMNEISFNATLLKELRMMALLRQVADPGGSEAKLWRDMRLHRISSELMVRLGHSSKLNAERAFLDTLFKAGRDSAERFLNDHAEDVGLRSSFDIDSLLEDD